MNSSSCIESEFNCASIVCNGEEGPTLGDDDVLVDEFPPCSVLEQEDVLIENSVLQDVVVIEQEAIQLHDLVSILPIEDVFIQETFDAKQTRLVLDVDHMEFVIPHEFQFDQLHYNCFFVLKFIQVDESKFRFVLVLLLLLKFYKVRGRVIMNKGAVFVLCVYCSSLTNMQAMIRGRIIFRERGNDMIQGGIDSSFEFIHEEL